MSDYKVAMGIALFLAIWNLGFVGIGGLSDPVIGWSYWLVNGVFIFIGGLLGLKLVKDSINPLS